MQPDKKYLEKKSAQTGFAKDNLEKVWRLTVLLKRITESPVLRDKFLLRGGTALNFIHSDIPRLSVDIDLDFIGALEKEAMEAQKPALLKEIHDLVSGLGYKSIGRDRGHASHQFILKYPNLWGSNAEVKTDINWLDRLPILEKKSLPFKTELFEVIPKFNVYTLVLEELLASKIVTFLNRQQPRDFYDVYKIAQNIVLYDKDLLRKLVVWTGCTEEEHFRKLIKFKGADINKRGFEQMVRPLLREAEKLKFDTAIKIVNQFIKSILIFNKDEKVFIDGFYKKQVKPKLLFGTYKYTSDILKHPNLLWRLKNMK
ncbi:MAG: nucleotidyl transferase AbiEii/AbiGii toxin family protein [Planctomycetes bacterium]|nr:nucleotidyl transferase AbiEii/AbiGii toxin family protein [Planctomycetota bacterium]